jgi:hypothetical protein
MPRIDNWRLNNKEHISEYNKKDYQKNKEKRREQRNIYAKTEEGKKAKKKGSWKFSGLHIGDDFDLIYERYINCKKCEFCNKEIKRRLMEHNHYSGECRGIVCDSCNRYMAQKDKNYRDVLFELTRWHLNKFLDVDLDAIPLN